ncbi:YheU family protein [Mangrovimicrobium sediminis]|uniref:YheU family protein n=1 Tax=Mangrovimicrobium sediminis TaxID=2562682 RepID=A0A4Z0M6V3_9GAMM|nr:YheU family protein [Haliea sp. SAOS-164]TGD75234.1 YheU family protein [Haliea sp. SAOS-164]
MSSYIAVPVERIAAETLQALLEEFASRDGTDYGAVELTLVEKTGNLRRQLDSGELCILYHLDTEQWDLVERQRAAELIAAENVNNGDEN